MNTYKHLLFPILFTLLILSCSKDDDTDPLIGVWQVEQLIENNVESALSDCFKKTTIEFKSDGTLVSINFIDEDGCRSETVNLTWNKINNNTLHITYVEDGDTDV